MFSRRFQKVLVPVATEASAALTSLQAFLNYRFLFDLWWSHAPSTPSANQELHNAAVAGEAVTEATVTEAVVTQATVTDETVTEASALSRRAAVLLSEPHAAYQATQRDVARVQERLAGLVLQHARLHQDQDQDQDQDQSQGYAGN